MGYQFVQWREGGKAGREEGGGKEGRGLSIDRVGWVRVGNREREEERQTSIPSLHHQLLVSRSLVI